MRYALALLLTLAACRTIHVAPPDSILEIRQRKAGRDVAFLDDTIPIVRFDPPFIYFMWKAQVEACSGATKEGMPSLFVAPIAPLGRDFAVARFYPARNAIVFSLGSVGTAWVVRHELLHWMLAPEDTKEHPPAWFSYDPAVGRCAAFIRPTEG